MIKTRWWNGALLATAMTAAANDPVMAAPIALNFAGVVTQAIFDPYDPLGGAVQAGSRLLAYMNFDSATPDSIADAGTGSYSWSDGANGLSAVVGGVIFPLMRSLTISVVNGPPGGIDQYLVFASEGTAGGLGNYFSMSMLLEDATGNAFIDDTLPTTTPDLDRFAVRSFTLNGQYTSTTGTFIQYEVQGLLAVPEPASAALVALGMLGCALGSRRRNAAS